LSLFGCLDDILVASHDAAEHLDHLRQVFTHLQEHGLQIHPDKCVLGTASLDFLGYHVDQHGWAQILQPLHDLLKTAPKGNTTDSALTAFKDIKEALASASFLVHPQPDAPTCILTDASNAAVGAILQQQEVVPLGVFLTEAEVQLV